MRARSAPADERFFEIAGRRVRVRMAGEGSPILLINGLGANVATWTPLNQRLQHFKVISFDAPGVGLSETPRLPYTIAGIADVARRVLDEVGVARADILGYSLGGAVAQRLAHDEPDRIRRLVLASSSCGAGAVPGALRALLAVTTPARHYSRIGQRLAMRMIDLAPAERDSGLIGEQIGSWHHQATPSARGYGLQMLAFSTFHSLPWLHHVSHPALVLTGADDHLIPMANSAILAAYLANARLLVFDRWGHYLLHDAASGAGDAIADFLAAENHVHSAAWRRAVPVDEAELARLLQEAPRSAHPARFTHSLIRRFNPPQRATE